MTRSKKKSARLQPERVSGITNAKDRRETLDVYLRAFTNRGFMEEHMDGSLWRGAFADMDHTRVAVADGRVVSAMTMGRRMIRFGPVAVPATTIGPVGTHDHYRKKGYSFAAMDDASDYMKENGFLLAYLQGIPNYYYRYGYYPYGTGSRLEFDRNAAKTAASEGRLVAMTRRHAGDIRRIYDRATADRACAAVRDTELWDWLLSYGRKSWLFRYPRAILNAEQQVCGYVTGGARHNFNIREIVVKPDEASCRAALGAIVREGKRLEVKRISLPVPWDDALAVFVRQHVDCEFKMWSNTTGGLLMKVVDFPALMRKLEPLFTRRWKAAQTSLPRTQFTLATEIGSVGLTICRDSVRVGSPVRGSRARVPQRWLSGLITGYHAARDIAPREGASIPARLLPVMEILFPSGWPWVYQADNY